MKKMAGVLTIAVALVGAITSCSNDNDFEQPTVQNEASRTVQFSVGASIGGDTRAVVETTGTTHTLKFSAGDKLFVFKKFDDKYAHGQLTIGTISADGKTASFNGEITLPTGVSTFDPENAEAVLIPAGGDAAFTITESEAACSVDYVSGSSNITIDEAIAKYSYVKGQLDASGDVALAANNAFLKMHIDGLTANTEYAVNFYNQAETNIFTENYTADATGQMDIVCWKMVDEAMWDYHFYISNATEKRYISVGSKQLTTKVYNVSKTASANAISFSLTDKNGATVNVNNYGVYQLYQTLSPYTATGYGVVGISNKYGNNVDLTLNNVTMDAAGIAIQCITTLTLVGENKFINNDSWGPYFGSYEATITGTGTLIDESKSGIYKSYTVDGGATVITNSTYAIRIYSAIAKIKNGTIKIPQAKVFTAKIYEEDGTTEITPTTETIGGVLYNVYTK